MTVNRYYVKSVYTYTDIFDVLPKLAIAQLASATAGWPLVATSMPRNIDPAFMLVCGPKPYCLRRSSSFTFLPI